MGNKIRLPAMLSDELAWKGMALVLLLALAVFAFGGGIALSAEGGIVRGKITNLTGGAKALPNQEVILHRVGEKSEDVTLNGKTDTQGNFEFSGLVTASFYKYYVTLTYNGASYTSEKVSFAQGETSKEIDLSVYDTTTSDKDISLDIEHVLVDVGDGLVMVNEIMVVRNSGEKAYIGEKEISPDKRETLRFYLPGGATELLPGEGLDKDSIVKTPEGFSYTKAVPPGTTNVAFMYHLNFGGSRISFSKKLSHNAKKLFVLILNTKAEVDVKGLKSQGLVDIQKKSYWSFTGDKLEPGTTFTISLKGLRKGSNTSLIIWVAVVFMLGLIGVLATYTLLRDKLRRKETVEEREMDPRDLLRQERRDLLTAIAELDDRFENGATPREAYYSERERKKSRLVEIIQELQGRRVEKQGET